MPKVNMRNMAGEEVGELELNPGLFEVAANIPLMHQVVVAEQANMRQGTAATKTRSDVRGGGAKPYRQKGTGRARQGTIRAPHYAHGGVVFGPHPRSYAQATPRKMRRGALRSALSARVADGDVVVVDEIKMEKISTKQMAAFLVSVEAFGRTLIVLEQIADEVRKSSRNIPGVTLRLSPGIGVREVLNADKIVMTRAAVARLEEVFAV